MLFAAAVGGVWLGQDRIVALFVQEANRYLTTPVRVGRMEVSLLDQFPQVSITLHDLRVSGSLPQDTVPLARARRLYFAFDAWDMARGHYRIRTVTLADGQVRVSHDPQGRANYDVIRYDTTATTSDQPFAFALENIRLERVGTVYDDQQRQQRYTVQVHDVKAQLDVEDMLVGVEAHGTMLVEALQLGPDAYFRQKELTLTTRLRVDRAARLVTIEPSELKVGAAAYSVAGRVNYRHAANLDLRAEGRNTDMQSVLALLPARLVKRLSAYRSRGDVYFGGTVRGEMSAKANPGIDVQFGCRDASLYHPALKQAVEHIFLKGSFSNGPAQAARTSVLRLREVRGTLQGRPFSGDLRYENFSDPSLALNLRTDFDVARALQFYPLAAVRSGSGTAQLTLQFAGNLRQFRARPATAAVRSSGELVVRNLQMHLRDFSQPFTGLNGSFVLRRNDVAVSGFAGRLGASDFRLSGMLRNALPWLLLPGQQLAVDAKLDSRLLDFNQLLRLRQPTPASSTKTAAAASPAGDYVFRLPPQLALQVQTTAQRVRFRRFRGQHLTGTIRLQNQVLSAPALSVAAAGGRVSFRGSLDARQPQLLRLSSTVSCQQLPLDSLFYTFEDFGQRFITARHLRGALTATAESDLYFDGALNPLTDRMEAEVNLTVRNGELNNFQPLQKLSMIAGRERLRHLRFAQLTTPVYIQSRTVYLPEMEIRSNVRGASLIRVTGTHTFDQQMNYHVSIPILPGLLQRTASMGTGPSLLLAIQGDEDNFRVTYDRSRTQVARPAPAAAPAAGRKPGLGEIVKPAPSANTTIPSEPRKAFELKKPEKKPAQPQPDEYFDF
ncbi:AsmA-like C-terminal region-containing protein [Hymenobacter sediminicola]|uniref:Uncharacterized protein n=1 Tax=Hymenobacter sediminicola TaxID=2761579 RepID=A0A7G7W729_9BACT|nr:AsmA-like C-terminal region-containing protein [Hymenobacter sediminicola]QNH62172.1 hypothetical protein H4317_18830 [Hymenobacter sediminicola]